MAKERRDSIGLDMRQKKYRYIRPAIATKIIQKTDDREESRGRAGNLESVFFLQIHQGFNPVSYSVKSGTVSVIQHTPQLQQVVGMNSERRLRAMKNAARAGKANSATLIRYGNEAVNSYSGGSREGIIKINFYNSKNTRTTPPSVMNLIGYITREEAALKYAPDTVDREYPLFNSDGIYTPEEAIEEMGSDEFFTMIISPADKNVDLEELTKKFLEQSVFPSCASHPRKYFACCHYNTAHPHVHVIISRVSQNILDDSLITLNGTYIRRHMKNDFSAMISGFRGKRSAIEKGELDAMKMRNTEIGKEDFRMVLNSEETDGGLVLKLSKKQGLDTPEMRSKLKALRRSGLCQSIVSYDEKTGLRDFSYIISREHARHTIRKLSKELFQKEDFTEDIIVDNHEEGKDYEGKIIDMKNSQGKSFFLIRDNDGLMHVWYEKEGKSMAPAEEGGFEIIKTSSGLSFRKKGRTRT